MNLRNLLAKKRPHPRADVAVGPVDDRFFCYDNRSWRGVVLFLERATPILAKPFTEKRFLIMPERRNVTMPEAGPGMARVFFFHVLIGDRLGPFGIP